MPELDVNNPHRANAARRWHPELWTPYVYRGVGYDIYEDQEAADDA